MKIQTGKLEIQSVSFILPRSHMLTPFSRLTEGAALQVSCAVDQADRAPAVSRMELRSQGSDRAGDKWPPGKACLFWVSTWPACPLTVT